MNKIQSKKYIEMKVSEPSYYMYHEITLVYHDSQNTTHPNQNAQNNSSHDLIGQIIKV